MIIHRIAKFQGNGHPVDGKPVYVYFAICGRPLYSLHQLPPGSNLALGKAPHAQCGKCFASEVKPRAVNAAPLPDGSLTDRMEEADGRVVGKEEVTGFGPVIERRDTDGREHQEGPGRTLRRDDNSGLGPLEGGDYG